MVKRKREETRDSSTTAKSHKGKKKDAEAEGSKIDELEDEEAQNEKAAGIKFNIVKITNVITREYPLSVVVTILRENVVVNSTEPIIIENRKTHEFEDETGEILFKSRYILEEELCTQLADTPFLLTVSVFFERPKTNKKGKEDKGKKKAKTAEPEVIDEEDLVKDYYSADLVMAQAPLDVMPLILGQDKFREELILETNNPDEEEVLLAYGDSIKVTVNMEIIFPPEIPEEAILNPPINLFTFTMRAIYNATLPEFVENCYCVAATPFLQRYKGENDVLDVPFRSSEEEKSSVPPPNPDYKLLIYEPGVLEFTATEVGVKKWSTIKQTNGRPAYTKERLLDNFLGIRNKLAINVEMLEYTEGPRVYWNQIHRLSLTKEKESTMLKMLIKFRHWPVEVIIADGPLPPPINTQQNDNSKTPKKKGATPAAKSKSSKELKHYIAFVNLENLLYPGVTSTASTAQLHLFDKSFAMKQWGLEEPMMNAWLPSTPAPAEKKPSTTRLSQGKQKSKSTPAGEETETLQSKVSKVECIPNIVPIESEGKPVFLWVDVKLAKPFVELMEFPKIIESITEILPKRAVFDDSDVGFMKTTKDNFKMCVENLSKVIAKEYCDYKQLQEHASEIPLCYKEQGFFHHLKLSGAENVIKESLTVPVTSYVAEVIGASAESSPKDIQEYLTMIYSRLSEDIYSIVSEFEILNRTEVKSPAPHLPLDHLIFMAAEADAENNLTKCKYFMYKRLESDVKNPEFWLDLAVALLHNGRYKEAMEFVKEALLLDSRNREGLLLLASLLTLNGKTSEAEICYDGLTRIYPRFCEGWIAFHCFYCLIGKSEGAEETHLRAIKCEAYNEKYEQHLVRFPILSWDYLYYYQEDDFFLRSIIYLLSLNLHELVEICIGEMLSVVAKKTPVYHYYLAACHYQQKRYKDSINHLEALVTISWRDSSFWILRGHNYYSLKKHTMARNAYEIAIKQCENVASIKFHLVHLRMGYYLLKNRKTQDAYEMFKVAVINYPTSTGWCGLGIACYKLEKYNDAELCLTESNILDPHVPITWAYLALLNGLKRDVDMFEQCTAQSFKKGLTNQSLVTKLWNNWKILKGDIDIHKIKGAKERILKTIMLKKKIKQQQRKHKKHKLLGDESEK